MAAAQRALVGRGDEHEELRRCAAAVLDHAPAAILLTGAAGVGKTSLADELVARHEGPVRRATAAEWESTRPYGVLAQLLDDGVGRPDRRRRVPGRSRRGGGRGHPGSGHRRVGPAR